MRKKDHVIVLYTTTTTTIHNVMGPYNHDEGLQMLRRMQDYIDSPYRVVLMRMQNAYDVMDLEKP